MPADAVDALIATVAVGHDPPREDLWRGTDTSGLADLVSNEQCKLWLFRQLKSKGLFPAVAPEFGAWLETKSRRIVATNQLVDAERERLVRILAAANIPFVLLKGAARQLLRSQAPLADARAMVDVDVLVPSEDLQRAWDCLMESGFTRCSDTNLTPADWVHLPPITSGSGVGVELHDRTQKNLTPAASWERLRGDARQLDCGGLTALVPSPTELFWHTLYHALYHGVGGFKLRFLLDGVSLMADPALDLAVVERRIAADEAGCRPHGARAWMDCVRWLAEGATGPSPRRYRVERVLRFSLSVLRRLPLHGRIAAPAIEEARRAEIGLGPRPAISGSGLAHRTRRRLLARAVRGLYWIERMRPEQA